MELRTGVSKQDIREQIWDYMESRNLADFPRPVHHRIPNFKGASRAAEHLPCLQAFKMARTIKVNPDAPQTNARFFVLDSKKTLLVPTPRLRTGLFNKITPPPGATKDVLRKCATSQVIDIPEALLEDHDLTVDYILTPTRVIATGCERPKPTGILWSKISREVMGKIPVLQSLRHREKQAGKDVTLRDEPRRLLGASSQQPAHLSAVRGPRDPPLPEPCPAQGEDGPTGTVCVGNLPRDARVSELKRALRELGAAPQRLTWQGPRGRALLHYQAPASAQQAVSRLQGLRLGAATVTVALARRQRASDLPGGRVQEPQPDCRPAVADL
ncbi:methenyltetrahydrofolate synthase domain-containing protein isoform X6 [Acinonyx jubatus]|uniref:Methenyltetrahydrofolate synthase domain-containing protein isoform X6 n=1 Tax=Acinonyx jubatus TaxID=32536 RepID=A0ABM3P640_ACIJB|nr:methenyltetrahydrofolate synthase domain-containing protein isoform X6 [Acinonyx jubatus]